MSETNTYPLILVPGLLGYGEQQKLLNRCLPYFGMTAGSAVHIAESAGISAHTASFQPLSGIWERTCELFAQISGGTVDYGADYSLRHNIARYGKSYNGFLPNFEQGSRKIILVAHGFGAPVARLLTYLLANGSPKEKGQGYDYTPLFEGGHGDAVHAVVTIAGNNDGTTLFQGLDYYVPDWKKGIVSTLIRSTAKTTGKTVEEATEDYLSATEGNVFYEAGLDGMAAFNAQMEPNPDTYYLAFTGEVTEDYTSRIKEKIPDKVASLLDIDKGGPRSPFAGRLHEAVTIQDVYLPGKKAGVLAPTSAFLCFFQNHLPENPIVGAEAKPNDGLINTNTSLAPSTEPVTGFSSVEKCYPGKWYQMPIEDRNHMSFLGLFEKPDHYRTEVQKFLRLVGGLESF